MPSPSGKRELIVGQRIAELEQCTTTTTTATNLREKLEGQVGKSQGLHKQFVDVVFD